SAAVGAGLTLGLYIPESLAAAKADGGPAGTGFEPNAFVRIARDNSVTVIAKHLEMGQGSYSGLATLVAEELGCSWDQVRVEGAPADVARYNNLLWGPMQGTGGSSAIANSWEQMRKAGATARVMLVSAAAEKWKVPAESLTVRDGVVSGKGKKATFGELADAAAKLTVPADVPLKDPKDFVYIGKRFPRKDSRSKANGTAKFTQDVKLPGMLTAVVLHPPRFDARVKSFNADATQEVPGVRYVVQIPTGIAVLAGNFWTAKKGRDALKVDWEEKDALKYSTADIFAEYKLLAAKPGAVARKDGDADKALAGAARKLEAEFEFPYLAHAAMELMNCVMRLDANGCEVWNGEQFQTVDQMAIAKVLGLKPEQVKLNMLYAGGSFGRRANPQSDYLLETAEIVKAINGKAPVKLVWTREDDMRGGYYRPMYYHRIAAALDDSGMPLAWQHR